MSVRRFVRGTVPWDQLDTVFDEFAERYDESELRVEFLDADNWFSTPCVVNDEWFVKVVTPQNAFVHSLFTGVRNLGVFTSGTEGFFEPYESPIEMARHELDATERMRSVGVNAPEPVEAFAVDELGVLVMEYLPAFRTLDDLDVDRIERTLDALFDALSQMHENGLAHGDLRAENVLVVGDDLYFIDATKVDEGGIAAARAYDLACALAVLEPLVGATVAVEHARERYSSAELLEAREFLDFVAVRPDHDFDVAAVKAEVDTAA